MASPSKTHWATAMGLVAVVVTATAWQACGAVTVRERQVSATDGEVRITVKTAYYEMDLVPLGAQAVRFESRYSNRPWLWKGTSGIADSGHLFMDNFLGQMSPAGELCFIKHTYKITRPDAQRLAIAFQARTKEGLRFHKTFVFRNSSPVVRVKLALVNESRDLIVHGLWPKMECRVAGVKERTRYYRPYTRGVLATGWEPARKRNEGQDFLKRPYAGWTAALQEDHQEGLVWLMDYNWLRTLYNCHAYWTVEWFYDDVPLPPKKRWETEYAMVLVKGFANIVHASRTVVAGMTLEPKNPFDLVHPDQPAGPAVVQVTHTLSRSLLGPLRQVKVAAVVREVDGGRTYKLPPRDIGNLVWEPATVTHELKVNPDIRLACRVTLDAVGPDGKPLTESYEHYWPGVGGEKFNLVAGKNQATYFRKPPKKRKQYAKPAGLSYTLNVPPRAIEFRGPGYGKLHVIEAAAKAGIREFNGAYFEFGWAGSKCTPVPTSYKQTFSHDLFVVNGVTAESLSDFGLESMRDCVHAGAGLLVIGGLYAYRAGAYADTRLEEMLPVALGTQTPDLEQLQPAQPVRIAAHARCLKGFTWPGRALCFWRHRLTPKKGAWVELCAGDKALLVCGSYGKGRVAAVTSAALGDPKPGQTPFWQAPAWPDALARVIRWLVFGKAHPGTGETR